ncbi:NAD+ diphosphatase [Rhodoligotrophos appendicifer]|uniref:NAD(+) diphosphatase n=1 Tax=Rhodoligotrophos appendicifer TaxID=987056 RepID=UPI00117BF363|nr:NAD(+) diphosphatase [Rhodoligotrophos appendicifer]
MKNEDLLAFTGNPLDRMAVRRVDEHWLQEQVGATGTIHLGFLADRPLLLVDDPLGTRPYSISMDWVREPVFLGRNDQDDLMFASLITEGTPETDFGPNVKAIDLRSLAIQGILPPPVLGILAQARTLLHWHATHRFCSKCGNRSEIREGGYKRVCRTCQSEHFPRTDPVSIMLVTRGDLCLLGRQSRFAPGMYSALAGFIEPGETIEDAARREVFEEAGIRIGSVHYHSSQPWPFPANLMIGVIAEALTEEIVVDYTELEDARWFHREEVRSMIRGTHPQGLAAPGPFAIASRLLKSFVDQDVAATVS